MVVKHSYRLILLLAGIMVMASLLPVTAQEKVISFTKDIDVLPVNPDSKTNIKIKLHVDKSRVKSGDTVKVYFEADRDCYLTLVDFGTSGKNTRLWPNQFSGPDNLVRAGQQYSFPSPQDKFQFRVSGPDGIERIVAYASTQKDKIVKEEDFTGFQGGFQSYAKQLKDLVVEASRRTDQMVGEEWGTAETRFVIGRGPTGGTIKSSNVYILGLGAATGALRYCGKDAQTFAQLIGEKLQVPSQNSKILLGAQATKSGFEGGLRWLAKTTQPEDLVFIYFSGHGTLVKDQPPAKHPDGLSSAFVCYHEKGTLQSDSPELKNILLLGSDFADLMKDVPARRRLIVVDSCHSGSINKDITGTYIPKYLPLLSPSQMKEIQIITSRTPTPSQPTQVTSSEFTESKESLLAACAKVESSYEDRSKNSGLFTYWLLEVIKTGGAPDLQTAFEGARDNVVKETGNAGLRQTPQVTDEYGLAKDIKF